MLSDFVSFQTSALRKRPQKFNYQRNKIMKLQKSIIALFAFFVFAAVTANAQFGDIMNKVQKKVDKTTKPVNTSTGNTQNGQVNDESLRWDLALKNTSFTGQVNDAAMQQMIQNGMNSDYGKGGLLVFTKQPSAKKSGAVEDTNLHFTSADSIYLTAFLADRFGADNMDKNLSLEIKILPVGDVKYAQTGYLANSMEINYGYYNGAPTNVLPLDFLPAGGKSAKYQSQVGDISRAMRKLPKGVHIVQLRLTSNMNGANAVGAFYFDNSAGGEASLDATLTAVKMPAAGMKNPALEKQIMDLENAGQGAGEARMIRVVITDKDWTPIRHEVTGVLLGRAITATVAVKGSDGACFQQSRTYAQSYNGKTYSNLRLDGTGRETEMACENIMK
jgi:hypothetical protein